MVALRPMTDAEYESYLTPAIAEYAAENVRAGHWRPEIADERARKSFAAWLPDGSKTTGQHLLSIYDLVVHEDARGRDIGRAALAALESLVRELGLSNIQLQVFAHDTAARRLYESTGFETTALIMGKTLGAETDSSA